MSFTNKIGEYMNYDKILTPEDLLKFMDIIEYGFLDNDGNRYGAWNEDDFEKNVLIKWRLSSPERLLNVKLGHCFDQVELERDWFNKNNYNFKTYYIMFLLDKPNNYSTHTFLIYENQGLWKLFEHSDYFNRGIHEFKSLEEALKYEMNHHIFENKKYNKIDKDIIKKLHVLEYSNIKYNIDFNEFVNEVLNNGKDVTPNLEDY